MAGKSGFLGELYYSITGEDNLKKILQEDKALAQEVAKIAGGIKIGKTRITQKDAEDILKVGNAYQGAAKGADQLAAARERALKKQSAGEFKEYIQSLTGYSDAQKQMSAYYRELEKEMGTAQTAAGSIKMLENELKKLKDTYRSLSETDRNSGIGRSLLTTINNADENLAKINAEMANNAALAKTMGTQYNGLRTQINMVARELPNLGISLSTFILSLSNNLPYLADEIAKANKEFNELKKTNQAATPVWKQMVGAVLNWQTALIVGITVLTAYSREIQAWVQEIIKGNSAASILADTQKFLNELHEEAAKSASKELSQLQLLYGVTQDATRTVKERTAATEQLQKLFPDYFGKLSSEAILVGNAQAAYDALAISIKNSEEARKINLENAALNETEIEAIKERREAEEQLAEAGKELERQRKLPWIINYKGIEDAELAYGHFLEKVERLNSKIEGIQESRKKLQKSYKQEVIPEFDILFKDMPEVTTFNKTLSDLDQKLAMSVIDQEEYNKKVNDAKGVLIAAADAANVGGSALEKLREEYIAFNKIELQKKDKTPYIDSEKQRSEIEKANQLLKEAVTKAELDIEQTRINLMKDGSEKTLAQIKLDYHKRNAAIEKESKDSIEKVRKLEREQWEKENPNFKKDKLQFTSIIDLTNQLKTLGNQMNETFGKGNVDLLARPLVDAAELAKKGWEDAGEGIATVFSSSFQLNQAGKDVMVHVTPILPDGTVLSPEELEQYIDTTLNDAENILQSDNKKNGGLGIVLNVDTDLSDKIAEDFGEGLHLAQEKYYDLKEEIKKNPLSIQVEDFQAQEKEKFQQSLDLQKKQVKEYFDSIAKEYQGYIDKRASIERKFAKDRDTLKKSRASESTLKELDYQENKALEAVDLEFAQREEKFKSWAEQITKLTLDDLRHLLLEAETELIKLERFSPDNGDALAKARAEIVVLREQMNKLNLKPNQGKGAIKEWQELYKTLNEVDRSFQEIGDTVGGTVGEIIKAAGTVTSSTLQMVNSIVNLANWSTTATKMAAEGATASIIAVEKASVILTVVSTALKAVTAIAGLFKKNDYMEKFRQETRKLNYELSLLKLNVQIDKNKDSILGDDLWTNAKDNINTATDALERYNTTLDNIANRKKYTGLTGLIAEANGIKNSYDSAAESIADMQLQVRHSTWFRSAKYESLKDAVPELFNEDGSVNKDALDKFLGSDTFKKLSAENQQYLQEMSDYWKAYEDAIDSVRDYLSDVFGELGDTITDALVDAFANGTDAAKAFKDSVSEMLEDLAKQMLYSAIFEDFIKEAQDKMMEVMKDEKKPDEEKFNEYADILGALTEGILSKQEDYEKILKKYQEMAKEQGLDLFKPDSEKQSGLSGAIQGVTEDTAELLGSYMNAMRADLSVNRANLQKLTDSVISPLNEMALAVANLKHLETIASNTGRNADAADKIYDLLDSVTRPSTGRKVNV